MSFAKPFDQVYQQSNSWSINGKRESVDDEDDMNAILDDTILDVGAGHLPVSSIASNMANEHKQSIGQPGSSMWMDGNRQQPQLALSHQLHGPLPRSDQSGASNIDHQQPLFINSSGQWSNMAASGTCTPTPSWTPIQQDFEDGVLIHAPPPANPLGQRHYHTAQGFGLPASIPMSPQSSQGWMSTASSDVAETQARVLKSPTLQPGSPFSVQKRDGVRKKNARFEIPKERNLDTIDTLIKYYTEKGDETQLKELKQQKRLLRNRQAALDSRQRKKQHTEELEKEKARTDEYIKELETDVENYRMGLQALQQQQAQWQQREIQLHEHMMQLQIDNEDFIRTSTVETGDLRRQNTILHEHLQQLEHENMILKSSAPMNDFSQFGHLAVDGQNNWAGYDVHQNMKVDHEDVMLARPQSNFVAEPPATKQEQPSNSTKNQYPFSWNTFYMCLLLGAFITSKTQTSQQTANASRVQQPALPSSSMLDEYRSESVNVLKTVLSSAPKPDAATQSMDGNIRRPSHGIQTSMGPTQTHPPTRAQQDMQAFSLTPAQYASITGMDSQFNEPQIYDSNFPSNQQHISHQHQSQQQLHTPITPTHATFSPRQQAKSQTVLQHAFASLKHDQDQIDRALMPDACDRSAVVSSAGLSDILNQVPEKVVNDFKKMIGDARAVANLEHAIEH